ncbi:MAG: site-2 protease family protein [Planctomycetota bacterium]|jgi:Zn-dependent protease
MINANWLLEKIPLIPPLLFSLALHELAHARTALAFGDPTAKRMGRCTLNPLVHLDPVGTLALIFCGFGWAKPVPVNPHNLHPPRWGSIAVSIAGPLSNLMLALLIALSLRAIISLGVRFETPLGEMLWFIMIYTMAVNICLCIFNLLPLFPLDGHHILREQLSPARQVGFMEWQMRYGRFVLMAIILGPYVVSVLGIEVFDPLRWVIANAITAMKYLVIPGA